MSLYLGIDVGTYETKGVLVDATGTIVSYASRRHKMLVPQPGWAEHRPLEDWWGDFVYVCRTLLADSGTDPKAIRGIGCSAIGPCLLPVDESGEPLTNGILYGVDTRATREIADLNESLGEELIFARCGNALTSQAVGPKILWLRRNQPEVFSRAHRLMTSTSFLVQRLTDEVVIDHYTAANYGPLYDVERQDWAADLAETIVPLERLPRLLWSTEIAGSVTKRAAEETGLAEGTAVLAGTVDAAAEAISVGVRNPGDMMLMYGSTIFIIMLTDGPVRDPRLWYAPWLFPGEHASMSGLATSGTLTHWFREQFARELEPEIAFEELAREAAGSPPGANGLLLLPYFSGERTPINDPHAKGVIFGLNLTHTRGDIYRALLEGIANGTSHVFETYRETGQTPTRLLAVGGGTKNPVWSQATSDISGIDQMVCRKTVGAAYGDAFLAAVAVGDAGLDDIGNWNPVETVIGAKPSGVYQRQFSIWRDVYDRTRTLMHDLDG